MIFLPHTHNNKLLKGNKYMYALTIETRPEQKLPFEIVERKGIGHPDTLCDAIAEQASRDYAAYCLEQFGKIAHHWFDKVMLLGGQSDIDFGKGILMHPYTVLFAGKGAHRVGKQEIPLEDILHTAAAKVLSSVLRGFDPSKHLRTEVRIVDYVDPGRTSGRYRPASEDDLISLDAEGRVSNDCNVCVGYAPLSLLENIVLKTEWEMTRGAFKKLFPDTGYDIKIVGTHRLDTIHLQVNLPFIAELIPNYSTYVKRVEAAEVAIKNFVKERFQISVNVEVNTTKSPTERRLYLTVTGSVADTGDVGVVGRGNRANGLITPCCPMSIEASCGKNPVDHTGKLYGILAIQLAQDIHAATGLSNTVILSTRKGKPIQDADQVCILIQDWARHQKQYEAAVKSMIQRGLQNIGDLTEKIIIKGVTQW
ncbi:methionine adenosyltransferase [Candidatus Hepatobacter penaei]|uniref:methionine adenosyltransferase n=1 Tax=Candidatus Hepatobacter penaei TaxID=1274402 RepID=UPI001C116884|nr:methionine adenosyltransferase [Candidatus Hepatobacter penaei]